MKVIYRFSDRGYPKQKLPIVNNENCFRNFCVNFLNRDLSDLVLIRDNCNSSTHTQFDSVVKQINFGACPIVIDTNNGNAGSFKFALEYAIQNFDENEIVYFVEGDYIHDVGSKEMLLEGYNLLDVMVEYVTLYAHPDKEMEEGIKSEYIFRSKSGYWRTADSTTMTFSARVKTLKEDKGIFDKWISGVHPNDHQMFLELRSKERLLVSPMPGYSTHGETKWLSPFKNWNKILSESIL
jgi:hypothetical protein